MDNSLLLGVWRIMIGLPPELWQKQLAKETQADLAFMTPDHQLVRDFVACCEQTLNDAAKIDIWVIADIPRLFDNDFIVAKYVGIRFFFQVECGKSLF